MTDFSIIIPAKNEELRIRQTLIDYSEFFRKTKKSFEILIVLNNCHDKTEDVVKEIKKIYKEVNYVNFSEPIGKGGALLEGFKLAKGDLITYTDADGSTSPETLFELSKKIEDYDGIIGSRWIKGANIIKKQTLKRRIASRAFNLLTKIILGLKFKDTQCAAKVFRKKAIESIKNKIEPTNFAIDAILLYNLKKNNFRIKEVPITWEDKAFSTLKMSKVIPNMFKAILKARFKN